MSRLPDRQLLTHDELTAYFLAVWNEVIEPVCGGRNDHVLDDFVANHTATEYPANQWRFQGGLGFGGKVYTASDMVCRVSCYPEDDTPKRSEAIAKANGLLLKIHERFFAEKQKVAQEIQR